MSCFNLLDHDVRENLAVLFRRMKLGHSAYVHLREKLLFGSDWYLSCIVSPFTGYEKYCCKWKNFLDSQKHVDKHLWLRLSFLNPMRFYRLNDKGILESLKKGLKKAGAADAQAESAFRHLCTCADEYADLENTIG